MVTSASLQEADEVPVVVPTVELPVVVELPVPEDPEVFEEEDPVLEPLWDCDGEETFSAGVRGPLVNWLTVMLLPVLFAGVVPCSEGVGAEGWSGERVPPGLVGEEPVDAVSRVRKARKLGAAIPCWVAVLRARSHIPTTTIARSRKMMSVTLRARFIMITAYYKNNYSPR